MPDNARIVLFGTIIVLALAACGTDKGTVTPVPETETGSREGADVEEADLEVVDPGDEPSPSAEPREFRIVTLLPRDAIPAIDNPVFLTAEEAGQEYAPEELVIGVVFNGEARAYSIPYLSGHEIVNDTVGGVKIAVTW